jgi:protein-S-isoprenylcysteine O-methyltransferase Ste14
MGISKLQKLFGVGPRGAVISLMVFMIAVWVDRLLGHPAILVSPAPIKVVGGCMAVIGLGLHFWSVWTLRNWWVKDKLCTMGPFKRFRHPMYAAWITFILPGAALYLNSWIIIFFAVLLHPIWHRLVLQEEKMMAKKFQKAYREYAARTGRFFPRIWNR